MIAPNSVATKAAAKNLPAVFLAGSNAAMNLSRSCFAGNKCQWFIEYFFITTYFKKQLSLFLLASLSKNIYENPYVLVSKTFEVDTSLAVS